MILSPKGFLDNRPDGPPRLTSEHKMAILQALSAMRDHFSHEHPPAVQADHHARGAAEALLASMIEAYPTDRSCVTCDYYQGEACLRWQQDVPSEYVEAGCAERKTEGAPF